MYLSRNWNSDFLDCNYENFEISKSDHNTYFRHSFPMVNYLCENDHDTYRLMEKKNFEIFRPFTYPYYIIFWRWSIIEFTIKEKSQCMSWLTRDLSRRLRSEKHICGYPAEIKIQRVNEYMIEVRSLNIGGEKNWRATWNSRLIILFLKYWWEYCTTWLFIHETIHYS